MAHLELTINKIIRLLLFLQHVPPALWSPGWYFVLGVVITKQNVGTNLHILVTYYISIPETLNFHWFFGSLVVFQRCLIHFKDLKLVS